MDELIKLLNEASVEINSKAWNCKHKEDKERFFELARKLSSQAMNLEGKVLYEP